MTDDTLGEEQDRLRKIAEHVPGIVYQYQMWPDGRSAFPYASAGILDIYGIRPEDVRSSAEEVFRVLHPDDLARVVDSILVSARDLTTWHETYRVNLPDGRMIWVEGESSPERLPDGSTLWHGYIRDITDRKLVDRQLQQLSQAVEQSPESIVITDLEANIEYVNDAFLKVTGYQRRDVIGRNPRMLQSGQTPSGRFDDMWSTLVAGNVWTGELLNRRKDGSQYVEHAIISPLRDEDGRITHYVAVKADITDKKRIEDELHAHRNHLEQMIVERTRELAEARDDAQRANAEKSAFLANMSHEIRTPLNSIIGFTDVLLSGGVGPLNDEQRNQLEIVSGASRHLLALISDVLDISKIEAGQLQVERRAFDLRDVIARATETLRGAAEKKGITMRMEIETDVAHAAGDARRTFQVLINLISNAVKFTERGTIAVAARRDGGDLVIEVSDTGSGIAEADQATLFKPFRQVGQRVNHRIDGVGLGLAISKRLVELQGGRIWVDSTPGAGSRFGFTMPAEDGTGAN